MVWSFFGCFRRRNNKDLLPTSDAVLPPSTPLLPISISSHHLHHADPLSPSDQLAAHFEDLPKQTDCSSNIRDEVAFLKSCGTLSETPSELRKKNEDTVHGGSYKSWHSWLLPSSSPAVAEAPCEKQNVRSVVRGLQLVTCSTTPVRSRSSSIVSMRGRSNMTAIQNDHRSPPWQRAMVSSTIRRPPEINAMSIDTPDNLCKTTTLPLSSNDIPIQDQDGTKVCDRDDGSSTKGNRSTGLEAIDALGISRLSFPEIVESVHESHVTSSSKILGSSNEIVFANGDLCRDESSHFLSRLRRNQRYATIDGSPFSPSNALSESASLCASTSSSPMSRTTGCATGQQNSVITSCSQMGTISSSRCRDLEHSISMSGWEESVTSCSCDNNFCYNENSAAVTRKSVNGDEYDDQDDAKTDDNIDPCFDAMSHVSGAVCQSNLEDMDSVYSSTETAIACTSPRMRSRSPSPVLTPVENLVQWKQLRGRDNNLELIPDGGTKREIQSCASPHKKVSFSATEDPPMNESVIADVNANGYSHWDIECGQVDARKTPILHVKKSSEPAKPIAVDLSLSHWLRPSIVEDDNSGCGSINESRFGGGMPPSARMRWDGMGIPNTTTKYKEDQRVKWYSSPFVVRLERELDKQESALQKRLFGRAALAEGSQH